MTEDTTDYSEKTRAIYHRQHKKVAADKVAMERFINMFSTEYFGLPDQYFADKKILDAGCGDTAKVIIALAKMGAAQLTGLDLGTDFIEVAQKTLGTYGIPQNKVTLKSGTVLELPFEDNQFDFVCCHGVLVHLNTLDEVSRAFSELARVTKPGGHLYTVFGLTGGLLEDAVYPALRAYYQDNPDFRSFIDTISPSVFETTLALIGDEMKAHTGEIIPPSGLNALFDTDLCVTIQNIIQAPVRLKVEERFILNHYTENGFTEIRRLQRYVKRKNIRKYAAPLHYNIHNDVSKLIYGSGNLEFIAPKK